MDQGIKMVQLKHVVGQIGESLSLILLKILVKSFEEMNLDIV